MEIFLGIVFVVITILLFIWVGAENNLGLVTLIILALICIDKGTDGKIAILQWIGSGITVWFKQFIS